MAVSASPRLRRIQRSSVALLVLGCAVNYVDRSTLAIANPLIRHDLGLSIADMGLLLSAFLWAYAAFQLPAGALVDRLGPRKLLGAGIFIWSLAQAPRRPGRQFLAVRRRAHLSRPGEVTAILRFGARRARSVQLVRERGGLPTGIGLLRAPSSAPAIAPPLLTVLMLAFGWRWMFVIMAGVGISVAILWCTIYRELARGRADRRRKSLPDRRGEARAGRRARHLGGLEAIVRLPRDLGHGAVGFFGEVYMGWVYQAWLPGYLEIERHMSIATTGWIAAIPFACGGVLGAASCCAGWLADFLAARGVSPINSCKIPVVIGLAGMAAFTIVTALTPSTLIAVIAVSTALAFNGMAGAMAWALASVAAPRHCTASLDSIQNCGAGDIGGALAPAITGYQSCRTLGVSFRRCCSAPRWGLRRL